MSQTLNHDILGTVIVRFNSQAKRAIARKRNGVIQLTVPSWTEQAHIVEILDKMQSKLLQLPNHSPALILEGSKISGLTFELLISRHTLHIFQATLKDGILHLLIPQKEDIAAPQTQKWIHQSIRAALRSEAKRILPPLTEELAQTYGFHYQYVKINKSKSRWGSCNSHGIINLSLFCMMLPLHLIRFIILHELCHTIEMNHSSRFWMHLDRVSQGKAKELTKELRQYQPFF